MIQRYYDPSTGQRGAIPPSDMPPPGTARPEPFTGSGYAWTPSDSPDDPHDVGYEDIGEQIEPLPTAVPPNIVIGGPSSRSRGQDFVVQPPAD